MMPLEMPDLYNININSAIKTCYRLVNIRLKFIREVYKIDYYKLLLWI